jgi:minichromosome maintenance protein 10
MEQYKSKAVEIPDIPLKPEEFSREQILRTVSRTGGLQPSALPESQPPGEKTPEPDSAAFEPYSGFHLKKRILPHQVLTRTLQDKQTYHLKDLLRDVKAPDFSLPDVESDIVIFAILAQKSDPRHHAPKPGGSGKPSSERGKYMVMTLVDLSFELELYLFDSGFARFWKLTPGTVVAILNPGIMPPPPGREATGRFSLVINSDADMILEIGQARDLGFCKSVKADGAQCHSWVNAKRTEYCEFHTNSAVSKMRSGRIELNSSGFGGGGDGPRNRWLKKKQQEEDEKKKKVTYDKYAHSAYFVSSAALVDGDGSITDRAEREEALKRRNVQKERERDIAKKLGELGGGAGKEYMTRRVTDAAASKKTSSNSTSTLTTSALPGERTARPDARALGLIAPKGEQPRIDLSRAKRKRPESSQSGASSTLTTGGDVVAGRVALGWGTSLSTKLARMKDGEKLDGSTPQGENIVKAFARVEAAKERIRSPVRKKTRFITEKGIREAGRESLGEPLNTAAAAATAAKIRGRQQVVLDDDDDDDLVIVK